jgi:hypothetical protein
MIRRMRRPVPNPSGPGDTPGITSAGVAGRLRRSCRASRSRCRGLICRDAATSRTRAASAGLPAAGRAGARADWRPLTDVDDLAHPKPQAAWRFLGQHRLSARWWCWRSSVGLIGWNVYTKLTANTVVAYFPTRWLRPLTPWGALVQARATLRTSWSVSAC